MVCRGGNARFAVHYQGCVRVTDFLPTAAALVEKLPRVLRRHRLMTTWMRLTGERPVQLVRIRGTSFGYADMDDGFLRLIPINQEFEKDFFAVADRLLERGGVLLDVGANYGLLSFGLAGKHGAAIDFHLFEPNRTLQTSIERTSALYPEMRLKMNAVAVSNIDGVVSFQIDQRQTGASHIVRDGGGLEVPCVTLDRYIEAERLTSVELLKLDVEGYELPALQGARRSLEGRIIQAVYFEYFEKWLRRVAPPSELIVFLDSVGFQVCFCRPADYLPLGGATHRVGSFYPGQAVDVRPVVGHCIPLMTDLLAVPKESLRKTEH